MKKRKLILHRETLHAMDLRGVAGGAIISGNRCTTPCLRTVYCDQGSYDTCTANTLENCSNLCETGGACPGPTGTC
jgi:hypothetical protein